MRKGFLMVLAVVLVAALAAPALADLSTSGFVRIKARTEQNYLNGYSGGGFSEIAGTVMEGRFFSGVDYLSLPLRKGGGIIASVIEQEGSAFKDRVSRLVLLGVE